MTRKCLHIVLSGLLACFASALPGCGERAQPATERSVVGEWTLDTRTMTDEAMRQVELRMREQARPARPARGAAAADPPTEGETAPAPAPEASGPSPTEINAAKEKERARLAGTFATLTVRADGTYSAEYRTKIDDKETRRVVVGEWTLASGVLVLREKEVLLDSEGATALAAHRFQAHRNRLEAITVRGTAPLGEVQQVYRRR